ncbi:MAG: response regulator transcription factor [Sulfurovaceae bacterium]
MKIYLIEDDLEMQELLVDYLQNHDYTVSAFDDPVTALETLGNKNNCDLVILDLMLPKLDGFDVCKKIRLMSDVPIIISSARGNLGDKVVAFEYGADDYLAKPYEPKELLIRIDAIFRRIKGLVSVQQIGEFQIDERKMEILQDGHQLELTRIEYEILVLLLHHPNQVLSREYISGHLKGEHSNLKDRAIDMHISNLRSKLLDDVKSPKYIKSIWGVGYKFIG